MSVRSIAKTAVFAGAKWLGANWLLRMKARHNLLVLCYHGVISEDHPEDPYRCRVAVSVQEFRRQLEAVGRCYHPVSAWEVLDWASGKATLPNRPALITFDDGFRNNLTYAAPELERYGIPALIHVTTGHISRNRLLWPQEIDERILNWRYEAFPMPNGRPDAPLPADHSGRIVMAQRVRAICKSLPDRLRTGYLDRLRDGPLTFRRDWHRELYDFLTWDDIRTLRRRGFAIGSHTVNHSILTRICAESLDRELRESKTTIEQVLGEECPWIAYPNGGPDNVSPEVSSAAGRVGYRIGFTLMEQLSPRRVDALMIDRICVTSQLPMTAFHARISGLSMHLQSLFSA